MLVLGSDGSFCKLTFRREWVRQIVVPTLVRFVQVLGLSLWMFEQIYGVICLVDVVVRRFRLQRGLKCEVLLRGCGCKSLMIVFLAEQFISCKRKAPEVLTIWDVSQFNTVYFLRSLSIKTNFPKVFIQQIYHQYRMLFGGRSVSPINTRTKTPQRQVSRSPIRKEPQKADAKSIQQKNQLKSKQNTGILYLLQEIYNQLNFQDYDAFPQQRIVEARKNIQRLSTFYKIQPVCPRHQDLLNLYCETDKEVICVSCVYKGNLEHKGHKIKPIDSIGKTIEYQIIRNEEKAKGLVDQLSILQEEITSMEKNICENFMNISNNSMLIINQTIKELELMKEQYDQKLSLAYRRTNTIVKRYNECLDLMISTLQSNLKKASTMKGLSKYLLLREVNKDSALMEDLIAKFNQNRMLMDQWKRSMKETERIFTRKKKQSFNKQDIYVVTQF